MSIVLSILPYLAIVVLIVLSAFFSGSEIAFTSCNKMRLEKASEEGKSSAAKLAFRMSENFDRALSAILMGNNLVNIAASSISALIAMDIAKRTNITEGTSAAISTVAMTIIILIFGEIMPKIASKRKADKVVLFAAYPVRILTIIFSPVLLIVAGIVKIFSLLWQNKGELAPTITEDELSTIIDTVEEEGVIDEDQSELLQSTLDFSDTTVQEVLKPRIDMVSIDIDDDDKTIVDTITQSRYSRIPVYENSIDNIIGVLSLNHYYRARLDGDKVNIRDILMKPYFVHKTMKLPALLSEMRENKIHLAIVLDEYGGTQGLVTMEDVLEQLVGEIWDESDIIVPDYVRTGENSYDVNGDMSIYDFFELAGLDEDDVEEFTTVGGFVTEKLESDPHEGDSFTYENLYIIVSEMDDMRVTKVSLVIKESEEEEE